LRVQRAISYLRNKCIISSQGDVSFVYPSRGLAYHWRTKFGVYHQPSVLHLIIRCLPSNVAKPHIIRAANIIRRSRHHLPKANIIQKTWQKVPKHR